MSDSRDYSTDENALVTETVESRSRLGRMSDGLRSYGEGAARAAEQSPILQGDPFMGRSSSEYSGNSASFGSFGAGGIAGGIAGGMAGGMAYADQRNEDPIFGNMFGGGSPGYMNDELGGTFIDMSSPFGFSGGMNDGMSQEDPIFGNLYGYGNSPAQNDFDYLGMDRGNAAMNPLDIGTYIGGNLGFAQEERGMPNEQMYAGSNLDLVFGAHGLEGGVNERALDDDLAYGIATYDPMAAIFGVPTQTQEAQRQQVAQQPVRGKSAVTGGRKSSP